DDGRGCPGRRSRADRIRPTRRAPASALWYERSSEFAVCRRSESMPGEDMRGAHASAVDPAEVIARAGIDLDLLAGGDEERHLNLRASLEGRGFGAAGGAVALHARLRGAAHK